jgi:hypothetical protein
VFAKLELQNSNQNTNLIKYTIKEMLKCKCCFKHTKIKKLLLNEMQMCKEETQKSALQNANMPRTNAK